MPAPKRRARPAARRAARPAAKRTTPKLAKLAGPLLTTTSPVMVVPAVAAGIFAEPDFGAWKLPVTVKGPGGKPAASGVVFLRGVLHCEPGAGPPADPEFPIFTLPAGMRPAQDGRLLATFRQQGPAPMEPLVLGISTNGTVTAQNKGFSFDSMIWVDGISFTAA